MRAKRFQLASNIFGVIAILFLAVDLMTNQTWASICSTICFVLDFVCICLQNRELKRAGEAVDTKKVAIGIVLGVVLALAVIWIVLIRVLNIGLE